MSLGFEYRIRYQRRKTLALHVLEDGAVEVRAPRGLSGAHIADWVQRRSNWVARARERIARRRRARLDLMPGDGADTAWFLGQPLRLQLVPGSRHRVRRDGARLTIDLPPPVALAQAARALDRWYLREARTLFGERFELGVERFRRCFGLPQAEPELRIRRMRRRWGSCTERGVVTLNRELIKLPLALTDYVIAHELCHLLEFNHSRHFFQLLSELMPDWREREALLKRY